MPVSIKEIASDDRIDRSGGPDSCWEWQGRVKNDGYGEVNRNDLVHRLAYEATHGPIPGGMCVCHHCDNPICANPSHLFLGTHSDNVRDRVAKGRSAVGTDNGRAKLSESDVLEIVALILGGERRRAVAKRFGVDQKAITLICLGKNWGNLLARYASGFIPLQFDIQPDTT